MANRKTYSVSNVKQLIDLNGDSTNFDIKFRVSSHNHEPFDILVVDQTTLDNNPNLQYKKADKGEISGDLKHENNVYQNYFLILRADNPCNCDVEITKKELPKAQKPVPQQPPVQPQQNHRALPGPPKSDGFNWMKILLVVGVVTAGGILFYWLSKKKENDDTKVAGVASPPDMEKGFKFYSPALSSHHSATPSASTRSSPGGMSTGGNPLLRRLKNLHVS